MEVDFNGNLDKTIAVPYWDDDQSYVFDPWASREHAKVIHDHGHTRWAESIFDNWQAGNFSKPANFDWSGKTVYIVGRGISLKWAVRHLNKKKRKGPMIALNHACMEEELDFKEDDYVMVVDDRAEDTITRDVSGLNLIGCPNIKKSFLEKGWGEIFGYTLWPNAPLDNFMRRLFPDLPQLNETMSVSVCAMHLAALSGAKRIVFVAHDHSVESGGLNFSWGKGFSTKTNLYLARLSQAMAVMAYYITQHTECEIVNCSKIPTLGYDMLAKGEAKKFDFIKHGNLPNYIE